MKSLKLAALLAVFTTTIFTLPTQFANAQEKDPKVKAILDKLTEKNKSYKTISADFSYNLKNTDEGIDESQKGSVLLMGQKYTLKIAGQEIISNGETVWNYSPDMNEVTITSLDDEEGEGSLFNPANLFTMYETGFKYSFEKEVAEGGETKAFIKLFPVDPTDKPYHTIVLKVNKTKTQLEQMEIRGKDGNIYTYKIINFQPNKPASASSFSFDESKADDVIDLR